MGPRQIRCESCLIRPHNTHTGAAPYESLMVADVGDVSTNVLNLEANIEIIQKHVASIVNTGCKPLIVGGDHTITYPILKAVKVCQNISTSWYVRFGCMQPNVTKKVECSRVAYHFIGDFKARVQRRTSHEPNRMQMRKTLCRSPSLSFISFRFGSCEVRRLTPALNSLLYGYIPDKRVGTRSEFSLPPTFNVDSLVIFALFVGKNAMFSNID